MQTSVRPTPRYSSNPRTAEELEWIAEVLRYHKINEQTTRSNKRGNKVSSSLAMIRSRTPTTLIMNNCSTNEYPR